jgi:hypothetical protein
VLRQIKFLKKLLSFVRISGFLHWKELTEKVTSSLIGQVHNLQKKVKFDEPANIQFTSVYYWWIFFIVMNLFNNLIAHCLKGNNRKPKRSYTVSSQYCKINDKSIWHYSCRPISNSKFHICNIL